MFYLKICSMLPLGNRGRSKIVNDLDASSEDRLFALIFMNVKATCISYRIQWFNLDDWNDVEDDEHPIELCH